MITGMESEKKERAVADLNQDMNQNSNPGPNTDPDTGQNGETDFPEGSEECGESIGTSLSDILRRVVNAAGRTDEICGTDTASGKSSGRSHFRRKKKIIIDNVIEREFVKAVHLAGGIAYKFTLPEFQGMPDRLVLFLSGNSVFVEFTTPEKVLNPIWTLRRRQLEYLGYPVICIDRLEQIIPAIQAILTWTPGESFPKKAGSIAQKRRSMEADGMSGYCSFSDSEMSRQNNLRQAITQLQREAYQQLQIQKLEDLRIREKKREQERRKGRKPINTDCEFHDRKDDRDICLIHMDMYFCSRDCAFATTGAGSIAPYGTRYMKGRL